MVNVKLDGRVVEIYLDYELIKTHLVEAPGHQACRLLSNVGEETR